MEPINGLKKSHIVSAKIVSTPNQTSWSQAYHAGNLLAVLSLTQKEQAVELNSLGKEILDTLEQEFFTLETKDLESIKQAVQATIQKIPESVSASLAIAALQLKDEAVLYIYGYGNIQILVKRADSLGTILPYSQELTASSGFLQDNDTVIVETKKFADIIPNDLLLSTLNRGVLADAAESFAPKVHEALDGEATALMVLFKKPVEETPVSPQEDELPEHTSTYIPSFPKRFPISFPHLPTLPGNLSHAKKLFLTIAVVIGIVLISSIFFAIKSEQNKKTQAMFGQLYPKALQKYEQGQSLLGLNKNLARDDFEEAKKILVEGKPKFRGGTSEEKQMNELLAKVETSLREASGAQTTKPKQVDADKSQLLQIYIKHSDALYVSQDEKNIYALTEKNILSIEKSSKTEKNIVKNDGYWKTPGGLGTFLGNIYVLDKPSGHILKFVAGDFIKSNYLSSSNKELSSATSLTIDGSVYVLLETGEIRKFTKGSPESFSLTGLDTPLSKPARIFTDVDANSIYILDTGNRRIVVIGKNGSYQAQYQADILKKAVDFEVLEKDKKIFVYSDKKVWEIDLK